MLKASALFLLPHIRYLNHTATQHSVALSLCKLPEIISHLLSNLLILCFTQIHPAALCASACVFGGKYIKPKPTLQIYVVLGTLDHSNASNTHTQIMLLWVFLCFVFSFYCIFCLLHMS